MNVIYCKYNINAILTFISKKKKNRHGHQRENNKMGEGFQKRISEEYGKGIFPNRGFIIRSESRSGSETFHLRSCRKGSQVLDAV